MRIRLFLLAISVLTLLTLGSLEFGAAQSKPEPAASKILALENKWNEAYKRGDVATMGSLLDDDFVITVEDGSTFSKSGYIAHNGGSTHVEISEMTEVKVRMHGNVAVVTGAYHEKGTEKGKPYESRDRLTDVWMKSKTGAWQVIAAHYGVPTSQ
jgi:ketosteroid isomerase-like protein